VTFPRHGLVALTLAMAGAGVVQAQSQPIASLACAAAVHCNGTVTPEEARLVLDLESQAAAEQAFIEASRDWPDHVWRCAATGDRCGSLTQNEARVLIPLADDAFAAAEVVRGRRPADAQPSRRDVADTPKGSDSPSRPPSGNKTPAIEVEIAKPGPSEVNLERAAPSGNFQPLDGTWHFAAGTAQTRGKCLAGISDAVARTAVAPRSGAATFQRPFHPSQVLASPQVKWQRLGPNHWRGVLAASQGKALQGSWTLRLASPTRMEGDSTVQVSVPSACTIRTPFTFARK
jgi:hypothetical protein